MILVLVGLLVVVGELDKVSGLTSADIVLLRWKEQDHHRLTMEKKPADMIKKSLKNTKKIRPSSAAAAAAAPSQEFESSKRKVRKGSDPIHNRP